MALTKDSSAVTSYIVDRLRANAAALGMVAESVYRGDQNLIPSYPAITVRSGPKRRTYGTLRQYDIVFRTILVVMYGKVGEIQLSEHEVDGFAEDVEDLLQSDRKLGAEPDNLVYNSWVDSIEPGVRLVGTSQIRANRITHVAQSREVF